MTILRGLDHNPLAYDGKIFPQHEVINHAAHEYVVGAVHTNTIEGFWSIFKRGVVGTFHKVSRKYMPLYVAEFQFRYNNRERRHLRSGSQRMLSFSLWLGELD